MTPIALARHAQSAQEQLRDCTLCPHLCGTARATAQGVCRVGVDSYIASEMIHVGEEAELSPTQAIFFSGCTATCRFCTAAAFAFRPTYGVRVTPAQLAARIVRRQDEGVRTVSFIGGDPVPHIPFLLAVAAELGDRKRVPWVFNSNFYMTATALDLLNPVIDIYLPDLKFGPATSVRDCGAELGGMPGYWDVVTAALTHVHRRGAALIVRHLLMPGHFECCTLPVLDWLAARPALRLSLLTQYLAPAHLKDHLAAPLAQADVAAARQAVAERQIELVR